MSELTGSLKSTPFTSVVSRKASQKKTVFKMKNIIHIVEYGRGPVIGVSSWDPVKIPGIMEYMKY